MRNLPPRMDGRPIDVEALFRRVRVLGRGRLSPTADPARLDAWVICLIATGASGDGRGRPESGPGGIRRGRRVPTLNTKETEIPWRREAAYWDGRSSTQTRT